MTFLLTFWKPIAGALFAMIVVAALLAAKHSYDEGKRNEGRAEVQAKFDAYVADARERASSLALQWDAERIKAETAAKGLDDERAKRLADARDRVRTLPAAVAGVVIAPDAVRVLQRAVDDANRVEAPRPAVEPVAPSAAATADPDDAASTVGQLAEWATEVTGLYGQCRAQVEGWQQFYGSLQAAQAAP